MVSDRHATTASRNGWIAVIVLAGGLFAAVTSTTVVSVALPTIGRDLHASPEQLSWIVDAYVLVYASLLVAGGVLGDQHGRKGLFLIGVAAFGAGSLITAIAPSIGVLLAGRVLQGAGPALLVPGSLTIIRATFEDPRRRAAAIGLWSTSSGVALAVGPALGGVIVEDLGWRWVFAVNAPFSALLVVLAAFFVPRVGRTPARERFDGLGAMLSSAAMAALALGIIQSPDWGWISVRTLCAFAVGVASLAWLVRREGRLARPLVDVRLFLRPAFTVANVAALVVFFAFVGAIVYFSAYFQIVQGHSPVRAGLDVSAIGVAFACAAPVSGRMVGRWGPNPPMLLGLAVSGLATLGLLRLSRDTGMGGIWWDFALVGAGTGMSLTPMTAQAVAAVDATRAGMASAVHNALRQLGQVLGVAVLGVVVYRGLPGSSNGRLDPERAGLFLTGLHHMIWVSGGTLLAATLLVALHTVRHAARTPQGSHAPERRRSPGSDREQLPAAEDRRGRAARR